MTNPAARVSVGYQDAQGDYLRAIASGFNGGPSGPTVVAANYTIPAPSASDGPPSSDAFLLVDTSGADVTITAQSSAGHTKGTTITVARLGNAGNITFSCPGDVLSGAGGNTSVVTTFARFTLAGNATGAPVWVKH